MRKLITLALVASLAPFAFANTNSNCATATASAHLNVFAPISVWTTQHLDFGYVALESLGLPATITLTAMNGSGGGIGTPTLQYQHCAPLAAGSGAPGQHGPREAVFDFTWDKRIQDVGLVVPATITLNGPNGLSTMIATNDTTASSEVVSSGGNHGSTRTNSFAVGGTVTIPGTYGTQVGPWRGSFSVGVNYL